jgi:hypothetical protein
MTRIRIAPDGTVRALWTDEIDWRSLGRLSVERASHVEFCRRRQMWYVQEARCCNALQCMFQRLTGRPFGAVLFWAKTREEALAWEHEYFGPGGEGWSEGAEQGCRPPLLT